MADFPLPLDFTLPKIPDFTLPGVPPLALPIPNLPDLSNILAVPNISSLLNVPSIPALQSLPNITSILNVQNIAQIPSLPNVSSLLNVPSLSSLIKIPNLTSFLKLPFPLGGLLKSDAPKVSSVAAPDARWGIYLGAIPVIEVDSIVTLEFKRDYRIADYPMEQGAFESYDKVTTPYDARLRMTMGGNTADRARFLATLDGIAQSLKLYDVVTPEAVYHNANIHHVDYKRAATSGAGMIVADVWLTEIRVTVVTVFVNTAVPSGANPVNIGTVQPVPATPAQKAPVVQHGASGSW